MHYHLMGIGGISLSGLAQVLQQGGHRVSGCDPQLSDVTRGLEQSGIKVWQGHSPEHLSEVDTLVISTAIKESEPELLFAQHQQIRVLRRIELVGEIVQGGFSIGITGSHGKSSTASMLASILMSAHTDPTVLLGAELGAIGGTARVGQGRYRLAEVDESDPLFQHLKLDIAVITNLEADHVSPDGKARPNYHASYAALQQAMRNFALNARQVIYNADPQWSLLADITGGANRIGVGLQAGDYRAAHITHQPFGSCFDLQYRQKPLGQIELNVPGEHNIANATAAAAAALSAGLSFAQVAQGLRQYVGPKRRFERVGELHGALIVDDYAHNTTKLEAVLKAAKSTGMRVRVVFQPHRFGRSEQEWPGYARALELSDEALVLDVYSFHEAPLRLNSEQIVGNIIEHLHRQGHAARHVGWQEGLEYLNATAQPGDLILTIGAGTITRFGRELLQGEA
jgi:UDP-N-acetylmuramate--alanine ligase